MQTFWEYLGKTVIIVMILWVVGFGLVMATVVLGSNSGGDMLTEHYRAILQAIFN